MSSEDTDVDALSESESSTATDVGEIESSRDSHESYSGDDSEYSTEYSVCYDSSSSDAGLPDWEDACKRAKREPFLCHELNKSQRRYLSGMLARVKRFLKYDFPVMSDCSGAEGGILALQALGVQVDHISSSEINCIATDFIAAQPFFHIVDTIGKLKEYVHGIMEIDSKAIGDVVSRPRLYFVGIHRSVAAPGISSNAKLQNALDSILAKAKNNCPPPTPWYDLLLDDVDQEAIDVLATMHGEKRPAIVNVSQQLHRMHVQRKFIPCLTPQCNMYLLHRGRCLTGLEMMLFQGFDIGKLNLYGLDDKVLFGEEDSGSEDAYQSNGKSVKRAEDEEEETSGTSSSSSSSASSKTTGNVAWYLEGRRVCRAAFVKILGISPGQCPRDVVNLLKRKLERLFQDRPEDVHVEHVTVIRDFDKELPVSAKIYNIFRKRKHDDDEHKVIPHSFTFVRRESLPRDLDQTKIDEFTDLADWLEKCYVRQYPRGRGEVSLPMDVKAEAAEAKPDDAGSQLCGVGPGPAIVQNLKEKVELAFLEATKDAHIGDMMSRWFPLTLEGQSDFAKVMLHYVGLPAVAQHVQPHRAINHIPADSKTDMWLNPWMIDYSRQCKYGESSKYPDMCTLRVHFFSILAAGFEASREPLDVRFVSEKGPMPIVDGIEIFSVKLVDGFTKSLCDVTAEDLSEDASMATCVATLKYLKGNFKRHDREEEYLYDALALTQRTGEKQQASPMELVSVFSEAVRLKKKTIGAKSTRDLLNLCVQDYNKVVGKGQKLKQETVKIIYNVLRCPLIFKETLLTMYSDYRHFNAGVIVAKEVSEMATISWVKRITAAHRSKAPPESSQKTQKAAQMGNEQLRELMEMCCLWEWITPVMQRCLGTGTQKLTDAWEMGTLDMELRGVVRVRDPAWNPEKMGFFLEARGHMQHQFMEKGQANVQNALRVAEKSAFDLKRQAAVAMLESVSVPNYQDHPQSLHKSAWTHVRRFGEDAFPVFNLQPKKRQGSERDFESPPMDPLVQPWLAQAMTGLQGGVRSASSELVVYVANLVAQGVVSSAKVTFLIQALQSAAANNPNNFVGVVLLPNRACDESYLNRKEEQDIKDGKDVKAETQENDEAEEDAEKAIDVEAVTALRDFKYQLQVTLQEPARQLSVKPLTLIFEEASIYGQRAACHEAWLVTSSTSTVMSRKSLFKRLIVEKIPMLPRAVVCLHLVAMCKCCLSSYFVSLSGTSEDMVKVEVGRKFLGDTNRLSRTQEQRQHLGGTGLMKKILTSLEISKSKTVVVDLFAHDGWLPLACLQLHMDKYSITCGSVAHTEIEYKFSKEVLLHEFFDRAKSKQLTIAGFPDFTAALADLTKVHTETSRPDYEYLVTVPVGGDLIVLAALMSKFENSVFAADFATALKKHDEEFNKKRKRASVADAQSQTENHRRKREANTPRLLESTCGDVSLFYDTDENSLWVGADKICGIPAKAEWLGFGSGNFVDGPTAKDVLSDANGRWYRYSLAGPLSDVIVIFESDRKLPDEIKALSVWNQAVSLKEFMVAMEDQGEIVSFMGHDKENETLKVNDKIVFVMDDVKGSPTKKRRISKVRPVVFGAYMDAVKLRAVRHPFKLAWRVRMNNNRQITPLRPVLIHMIEPLRAAAWALSFPIMDTVSTETSPSFNSPPFSVEAYESDLQSLSAAAKEGETQAKPSGLRKLERFEVNSDGDEPEETGSWDLEMEEEEEEEEGGSKKKPAKKQHPKKGAKKTQKKKKKQSESDEPDKKDKKRKKDDDDDDIDSDEEAPKRGRGRPKKTRQSNAKGSSKRGGSTKETRKKSSKKKGNKGGKRRSTAGGGDLESLLQKAQDAERRFGFGSVAVSSSDNEESQCAHVDEPVAGTAAAAQPGPDVDNQPPPERNPVGTQIETPALESRDTEKNGFAAAAGEATDLVHVTQEIKGSLAAAAGDPTELAETLQDEIKDSQGEAAVEPKELAQTLQDGYHQEIKDSQEEATVEPEELVQTQQDGYHQEIKDSQTDAVELVQTQQVQAEMNSSWGNAVREPMEPPEKNLKEDPAGEANEPVPTHTPKASATAVDLVSPESEIKDYEDDTPTPKRALRAKKLHEALHIEMRSEAYSCQIQGKARPGSTQEECFAQGQECEQECQAEKCEQAGDEPDKAEESEQDGEPRAEEWKQDDEPQAEESEQDDEPQAEEWEQDEQPQAEEWKQDEEPDKAEEWKQDDEPPAEECCQ
ncbi:hypothetical protein AK812_SmicGene7853 [Symbiodinium microadriaticum]|uniref:Uncharacterized protein n=1 Tax=Symbiodinium microadriaticum TaxID=2951 RepID=A0A1Q9EMG2_SYMMI|nr:hypothetical protein AK812_SmicGene7853 [Symbiodinium microadriaticum]